MVAAAPYQSDVALNLALAVVASSNAPVLLLDGELTVKGASKAVVADGKLSGPIPGPDGHDRIGIDLETTVDRHDQGPRDDRGRPDGHGVVGRPHREGQR